MNYRHIYHAGNICDVVKHVALVMALEHLRQKDSAFFVLDTHAGVGLYDLRDARAAKTAEAEAGIFKFLITGQRDPAFAAYVEALREQNPGWNPSQGADGFHLYPGSPMLIRHFLRSQDRMAACELHDEDVIELRRCMGRQKNIALHHRDGYEALRAFLPPAEKRGLVVIDPPYEQPDELMRLVTEVTEAHRRWPTGQFMIWYPVKERPALWRFHEAWAESGMPKILCAEFIFQEELRSDRLNGSGFIFINPPWQMDERLRRAFTALHQAMQTGHQALTVKWLAGEG